MQQLIIEKSGAAPSERFLGFGNDFTNWKNAKTFFSHLEAENAISQHCQGLAVRIVSRR